MSSTKQAALTPRDCNIISTSTSLTFLYPVASIQLPLFFSLMAVYKRLQKFIAWCFEEDENHYLRRPIFMGIVVIIFFLTLMLLFPGYFGYI